MLNMDQLAWAGVSEATELALHLGIDRKAWRAALHEMVCKLDRVEAVEQAEQIAKGATK